MMIVLLSFFQALLADETISNVPVLVLGNKIDRPEAVSEGGLRGAFALDGQLTGKVGPTYLLTLRDDVIPARVWADVLVSSSFIFVPNRETCL